jgi:hypothetical protein
LGSVLEFLNSHGRNYVLSVKSNIQQQLMGAISVRLIASARSSAHEREAFLISVCAENESKWIRPFIYLHSCFTDGGAQIKRH